MVKTCKPVENKSSAIIGDQYIQGVEISVILWFQNKREDNHIKRPKNQVQTTVSAT
jgi:hypothetical protein